MFSKSKLLWSPDNEKETYEQVASLANPVGARIIICARTRGQRDTTYEITRVVPNVGVFGFEVTEQRSR